MSDFWNAQRTARQDQMQAAEEQSMHLVGHFMTAIPSGSYRAVSPGSGGPVSERWIKVVMDHVKAHTMRYCPHIANGPIASMVAFWEPDRLQCMSCFSQGEALVGDADVTCDECGTVDREGVHQQVVNIGVITIVGGLCTPCQRRDKGLA